MVITYLRESGLVISITEGFPKVWEEKNQLLIEGGICPLLNDLSKSGWGYYEDERIERKYSEDLIELPLYMKDLDLKPVAERPPSLQNKVDQLEGRVNEMKKDIEELKRMK